MKGSAPVIRRQLDFGPKLEGAIDGGGMFVNPVAVRGKLLRHGRGIFRMCEGRNPSMEKKCGTRRPNL